MKSPVMGLEMQQSSPEYRRLGATDTDAVAALLQETSAAATRGFLDPRSDGELEAILGDARNINFGGFAGGTLIGYTLCKVGPLAALPISQSLIAGRPDIPVGHVCGTAVAPAHQGGGIGKQLLALRNETLVAEGVDHCFGVTVVTNLRSMRAYFANGSLLVGLERDEFGLNFVHYTGTFAKGPWQAREQLPIIEINAIRELFESNHIAHGITRDEAPDLILDLAGHAKT